MREMAVESKNIAGVELICHVDETGISEIGGRIAVFMDDFSNLSGRKRNLKRNSEEASLHVGKHCVNGISSTAQQVTTLSNDGLTGHKWPMNRLKGANTSLMRPFVLIEQGKDDTRVDEDWRHR
jgi:hypothetical protein